MILSNQIHCLHCGEKPWSAHRHDFVRCGCESDQRAVYVDGGMDYLRRLKNPDSNFEDISIVLEDKHVDGLKAAIADTSKNELGKLCNVARYLRDEMDINIGDKQDGQ